MQKASLRPLAVATVLAFWAGGCTLRPDSITSIADFQRGQFGGGAKLVDPAELSAKLASSRAETSANDPVSLSAKAAPSPQLHVAAARLSEKRGDVRVAQRHYQQALKIDSQHLDALVGYARLKDRQGRMDEATDLYQRAAKAHPDEASVFNALGLCLARQRMFVESVAAFERAIQLQPEKGLYRNNMAMVLVETGEVEAALSNLKAVDGEAVAHYNVGYILQKKGDSEAAARHFAKALEKNPSLVQASVWLKKLGRQPEQIAQSAPRIASEKTSDDAPLDMPDEPFPARQANDPAPLPPLPRPTSAGGTGVSPVEGEQGQDARPSRREGQRVGQRKPIVRQLPPVAGQAAGGTGVSPVRGEHGQDARATRRLPAPLPPPTSIGLSVRGSQSSGGAFPVVHPLPPVEHAPLPP